jgi:isopenicillin-N N-acyltransferase-like protein
MTVLHDQTFPSYRFAGTHREIGRQFGEACAEAIHEHRARVVSRLRNQVGIDHQQALALALDFRPIVTKYAPFFDDEIQGMAEGAGLTVADVYALQLRAELAVLAKHQSPADAGETGDECTTFAVLPEATANGIGLVGQNADLPAFYRDVAVVVELVPNDGPRLLMLTPAGQVSYIGINDRGLGVFANYLTCGGWRLGFPRYLLSRLALTHGTVAGAVSAVRAVPRASSRNLIMLDTGGSAVDLETTPTDDGPLLPVDGLLAHANHYLADNLLAAEQSPARHRENSRIRYQRMSELLAAARGSLTAATMETICRDRANYPDCLSRAKADDATSDMMTIASVIAEPALGQVRVAVGPPHEHHYQLYSFSPESTAAPRPREAVTAGSL